MRGCLIPQPVRSVGFPRFIDALRPAAFYSLPAVELLDVRLDVEQRSPVEHVDAGYFEHVAPHTLQLHH